MSPGRTAAALVALLAALVWSACGGGLPEGWGPGKGPADPPGVCTPPYVGAGRVLAPALDGPKHLATDGVDLYFTEAASFVEGAGTLSKVALAGGPVTEVAGAFSTPDALAVDAQYVFLLDAAGLWRVNKATAQETLIDPLSANVQSGETQVIVAGAELVIASGFEPLYRMAKDGTGKIALHTAPAGGTIKTAVVDGSEVWFLLTGDASLAGVTGLYRVPLDGSAAAQRIFAGPQIGRGLTLTADAIVWAEGAGATDGMIRALAKADLSTTKTLAEGLRSPAHPLVSGEFVYFQVRTDPPPDFPASELFLRRTSPCDPIGAPVVGPTGYGAGDLLEVGGTLYFTSVGIGQQGYVGAVP